MPANHVPVEAKPQSKFRQRLDAMRAKRLKEGVGPVGRVWDATKRPFIDGTAFEVLSYAAASGATWAASGAPGVRSPEWKAFMQKSAVPLAGAALAARTVAKSQKARLNVQGERFMQHVLTDPDFARRAEYDLVQRFSRNPGGTMKLYGTDALGLAAVFSVLHKRRKSPDGNYSMSRHEESDKFRSVMEPLMRHYALKTPDFQDNVVHKLMERHGFGIKNKTLIGIRRQQVENPAEAVKMIAIPRSISSFLPSSIESASPSTLRQVEDIVLFSSAVVRAKQQKVKETGK